VIDATDRKIVHAMQLDGRAPFTRIAAVLGLSEQTVARRWRRLRADGVVRVLGLTAPDGAEPNWFVRVRVQPAAAGSHQSSAPVTSSGLTRCPPGNSS